MNITIGTLAHNGRNMDRKETVTRWTLIAFDDNQFKELATIRWYMGRSSSASVVYCTIWVTGHVVTDGCSGSGHAGGGGYCKSSAAFEDALHKAGIKTDKGISGRGMTVVEDALIALGKHAGFEHVKLIRG
jgi:hypothetical protein